LVVTQKIKRADRKDQGQGKTNGIHHHSKNDSSKGRESERERDDNQTGKET